MTADGAVVLAKSGEAAKAGPIGLAVILLLCIACYFLFKSMSKHMKIVRENFPTAEAPVRPTAPIAGQRAEVIRTDQATAQPALPSAAQDRDDSPPQPAADEPDRPTRTDS